MPYLILCLISALLAGVSGFLSGERAQQGDVG